jgi:hypothetical protein
VAALRLHIAGRPLPALTSRRVPVVVLTRADPRMGAKWERPPIASDVEAANHVQHTPPSSSRPLLAEADVGAPSL